jgi:hypothetical protein
MSSIENLIREQMKPVAKKDGITEAYPGFGKSRDAEPPAQGGSQKPGYETLVKGGGSDAAVKAAGATTLSPSTGPMDKTPPKQGSSQDSPVEDLGADEPGVKAAAKISQTTKKPTGKGAGAAKNFTTFVDPTSVVNQPSSKGNVAQEGVDGEGITQEEYDALSDEEKAEYSPITTEQDELTTEEYEALSDEEKAEYELIDLDEKKDEKEDDDEDEDDEDEKDDKKKKKFFGKEHVEADVNALFGEETSLSEEFKNKAASLFEAVVTARVADLRSEIEKEVQAEADAQVEKFVEEMTEKVDAYLNYVVEQWLEQNEVGVVDGLRAEITEEFMEGLKNLFTEHYIEVPEEKYDLIGEMAARNEELQAALDAQINETVELKNGLSTAKRDAVITAVTEGLAQTEVEKFSSLIEDVTFEDERSYSEKLTVLRNNYFPKKVGTMTTLPIDDEAVIEAEVTPGMARYANAISRGVPKF